jgi:hypothetical protein
MEKPLKSLMVFSSPGDRASLYALQSNACFEGLFCFGLKIAKSTGSLLA